MNLASGRKTILIAMALIFVSMGSAVPGESDDDDHDRALGALKNGQAKPLSDILEIVRSQLEGEVIGVKFEYDNNRWIYDLKVLSPMGTLKEVSVDALTAAILDDKED